MNVISTEKGIANTTVKAMTKGEEIALRDSKEVKTSVEAVRKGNVEAKSNNYYRVPQAMIPDEITETTRCNDNFISNGKVQLDYDVHGGWEVIYNSLKDRFEYLGVLQFERSARYGAHITVRQIDGLDRLDTIKYLEEITGFAFDHAYKALSQPCFLVSNEDVLYVHEDYWLTHCNPNSNIDISAFIEKQYQDSAKAAYVANNFNYYQTTTTDMEDSIRSITEYCEQNNIDIAPDYGSWVKLAFSLHAALGDNNGYEYFRRLSTLWHGGNITEREISKKWSQTVDVQRVTGSTFFWMAQQAGINLNYDV